MFDWSVIGYREEMKLPFHSSHKEGNKTGSNNYQEVFNQKHSYNNDINRYTSYHIVISGMT